MVMRPITCLTVARLKKQLVGRFGLKPAPCCGLYGGIEGEGVRTGDWSWLWGGAFVYCVPVREVVPQLKFTDAFGRLFVGDCCW